ncbi:hypothetical protein MKX03_023489, partial [Papaver bracteatum]
MNLTSNYCNSHHRWIMRRLSNGYVKPNMKHLIQWITSKLNCFSEKERDHIILDLYIGTEENLTEGKGVKEIPIKKRKGSTEVRKPNIGKATNNLLPVCNEYEEHRQSCKAKPSIAKETNSYNLAEGVGTRTIDIVELASTAEE